MSLTHFKDNKHIIILNYDLAISFEGFQHELTENQEYEFLSKLHKNIPLIKLTLT